MWGGDSMIFVPVIIVIAIAIIVAPTTTSSRGRRRKPKGLFSTLLEGQRRTERKNGSHRGVMCGPGGSKRR